MRRLYLVLFAGLVWLVGLAVSISSPALHAQSNAARSAGSNLLGGARGIVKTTLEGQVQAADGVMVQLIAQTNGVRTTVYTNDKGEYEFPKLETGDYVLRIARPMEFRRYQKEAVRIDGSPVLPEIMLERVSKTQFLPPTPDILAQLSGAEWLANMPGSAYEKRLFVNACTNSCHSGDRPFLQKFNAADWNKIVNRMTNYSLRTLVSSSGRTDLQADAKVIANWLARVRGLDSEYPEIEPFPRPTGMATRAIVTEYEVPWTLINVHDVSGDAQGNIWFNVNRSPFVGKLDPKTGKVVSYRVEPVNHPALPYNQKTTEEIGVHPGLHWIEADHKTGNVWFSDTWAGTINRLDPRTGEMKTAVTRLQGNMGLAPDGLAVWRVADGKLKRYDTKTLFDHGTKVVEPTQEWPLKITRSNYGNFVSKDSNYVGGGGDTIVWFDVRRNEVREIPLTIGGSKGRGTFDHEGNVWAGAEKLTKYDPKTGAVTQYTPPTPYYHSYSAKVDKNGEIWSGQQSGGRIGRFNPRTGLWIEYVLPTAWSFDFNAWIDDSTTPPTFWYGDQHGYIVRVQPLE